ncbi:MAG: SspB family protein [Sphingomonadales bacterium]
MRYQELVQEAMRGVVRQILERVAREGLIGEHHLYLAFDTRHDGVRLADFLREQYPNEMTIVLQHEFSNLEVAQDYFSVTLRFSGRPQTLIIPFEAITNFLDPSVPFGLQLKTDPEKEKNVEIEEELDETPRAEAMMSAPAEGSAGNIIDFEGFRKK